MRRRWFGSHWGEPDLLMGNHIATPVGQACVKCGKPVETSDQGWLLGSGSDDVEAHLSGPLHLECSAPPTALPPARLH